MRTTPVQTIDYTLSPRNEIDCVGFEQTQIYLSRLLQQGDNLAVPEDKHTGTLAKQWLLS